MPERYICDACGGEFEKTYPDAEAIAEYERGFGIPFDPADVAEVCDDCYKAIITAYPPEEFSRRQDNAGL